MPPQLHRAFSPMCTALFCKLMELNIWRIVFMLIALRSISYFLWIWALCPWMILSEVQHWILHCSAEYYVMQCLDSHSCSNSYIGVSTQASHTSPQHSNRLTWIMVLSLEHEADFQKLWLCMQSMCWTVRLIPGVFQNPNHSAHKNRLFICCRILNRLNKGVGFCVFQVHSPLTVG